MKIRPAAILALLVRRRRLTDDRSWYGFPPRRRPTHPAVWLTRATFLGIVLFGALVASGTIR